MVVACLFWWRWHWAVVAVICPACGTDWQPQVEQQVFYLQFLSTVEKTVPSPALRSLQTQPLGSLFFWTFYALHTHTLTLKRHVTCHHIKSQTNVCFWRPTQVAVDLQHHGLCQYSEYHQMGPFLFPNKSWVFFFNFRVETHLKMHLNHHATLKIFTEYKLMTFTFRVRCS